MSRRAVARFALLFIAWFVVGLLVAFDLLAFISSLVIVLPLAGPLTGGLVVLLDRRWPSPAARWGLAVGAAAMPFFIAYNNRHGPGTYCHAFQAGQYTGTSCGDQWDPRPWAAIGIGLVLTGFVGAWWTGFRACCSGRGAGSLGPPRADAG